MLVEPAMSDSQIHDEPSKVTAEGGVVIVDGPDGVAVSLTPEAAIETSDRLLQAGTQARGQNLERQQQQNP